MREPIRNITTQHAREVIESVFGVIKMISSPISPSADNRSWKLIIDGLNEPHKNRFVKPLAKNSDRGIRVNPQTKYWEKRIPHPVRGRDKPTSFTKKTALTLIPPRGNIQLFAPRYGTPIGLLFDWRLCHRKGDRYVFAQNIVSDNKPWLDGNSQPPEGIPFEQLQQQLRELNPHEVAEQNELLGGLSRDAVLAVVAPENTLFIRINALAKKNLMLQDAKLDLPIFIVDPNVGMVEYTLEMQQQDIAEILNNAYPPEIKSLAESCINPYDLVPAHDSRIQPSAPPLELIENSLVVKGSTPRDVRRRILFHLDFFSLILLRQQIPHHASPGLLRLKTDVNFVIRQVGPFVLSQLVEFKPEHAGLPYQTLLKLYAPVIKSQWKKAFKSSKTLRFALTLLPHLVLLNSDVLAGTPQAYALEGKAEEGTWGECEIKYHDVGLHYRNNILFAGLPHFSYHQLSQLALLDPSWINPTFKSLHAIYTLTLINGNAAKFNILINYPAISEMWRKFVYIAPKKLLMEAALDPILKKPTLFAMVDAINLTTTLDGIQMNYDRFAHSPWINVRKNPKWDTFCTLFHPKRTLGCPAYPDTQQKVIFALQRRAFEILTESDYSDADVQALHTSPLFDREHIRRGVSEECYINLERLMPKVLGKIK